MDKKVKEAIFWVLVYGVLIIFLVLDVVLPYIHGANCEISLPVTIILLYIILYGRKNKNTSGRQLFQLSILVVGVGIAMVVQELGSLSAIGMTGVVIYIGVLLLLFLVYLTQYPYSKAFQESQKYFEETKDAEGYSQKCEELYELAKQKKKRNLWRYRFNAATSYIHCGEHEKADVMLAEIYDDIQNGIIKYDEVLVGVIDYSRMWNDIYRKDYEHMQQMNMESREILSKVKQNEKFAKTLIFIKFFQAMAERDYARSYEELKKLQSDIRLEGSSVVREHMEFFEVQVLEILGKTEESQKKAENLKQHAKLCCILKQL